MGEIFTFLLINRRIFTSYINFIFFEKKDSWGIVFSFMQDINYMSRDYATLRPSELQPALTCIFYMHWPELKHYTSLFSLAVSYVFGIQSSPLFLPSSFLFIFIFLFFIYLSWIRTILIFIDFFLISNFYF